MAYTFRYGDRPLDGLTVQRAVGRGGFGEVYYALMDSGKQVALKYLRENPDVELRGIAHVMNLKSPHLITVYDVRKNPEGDPFVIMEYVSGPSLRDLIDASPGGMGPQKAAFFLCGIAQGLSYLHDRGIVHRDLKPGNIFYDDGYVKIGDYGLSKHIACSQHSGQTVSVGTVHYMAPEIGSGSYTKAIDIYALGVILFEMLTGRLPFAGGSMGEILMRHLNDRPDLAGVPEPFRAVIARALAKNPTDRYQNVNEMVDAVREVADVRRGLDSFDPASLSNAPRDDRTDRDRTMTTPPRPHAETLDVRAGLPPIPALPRPRPTVIGMKIGNMGLSPGSLPDRLQQRADRLAKKIEARAARIEARLTGRPYVPPLPPATARPGFNRWTHMLIIAAVIVAISLAIGGLSNLPGGESAGVAVGLYLFGGTFAAILTYFRLLRKSAAPSSGLARMAYGAIAGMFMLPAIAAAGDSSPMLQRMAFAPILVMTLCDWSKRIEQGRMGEVRMKSAIWPGILGLIIANMVHVDGVQWIAALVCAGLSLLTQGAAAMWPIAAGEPRLSDRSATNSGFGPPQPADSPASPTPRSSDFQGAAPQPDFGYRASPVAPPAASMPMSAPVVIDAAGPSFVARTANAGFSFIGKVLLLAGLLSALGYGALEQSRARSGNDFQLELGGTVIHPLRDTPRIGTLGFLAIGALFLVLSRRHDGVAHVLRGLIGAIAAGVSALLALSWGYDALLILFGSNDWRNLNDTHIAPLAVIIGLFTLAMVLLFWPKPRRRANTVIV